MNIVKRVKDLYKKSPVKFISISLLILVGLISFWYVTLPIIIVVYLWKKFKEDDKKKHGTKKKCPHCKTEIDWDASRCPSCHGKIYVWTSDKKLGAMIIGVLLFIGIMNIGSNDSSTIPPTVNQAPVQNSISSDQAKKELNDFLTLSEKAGVVTSYEFSEKANVVYVSKTWYTQTVQFKKDFIAKIAMLKKSMTGYSHFQVRDTYSNEMVGELTAFSSSIEVYK